MGELAGGELVVGVDLMVLVEVEVVDVRISQDDDCEIMETKFCKFIAPGSSKLIPD